MKINSWKRIEYTVLGISFNILFSDYKVIKANCKLKNIEDYRK